MASLFNANVLLSGASGFTGNYLKRVLQQQGARIIELQSDIRDASHLATELSAHRIDYVIHLAAITFVPHGTDLDVYEINLFGTQNLLEALKKTQNLLKKVILVSSANVYGNTSATSLSETICPRPINHYAISKLSMEHMAMQYLSDFPILITRPFNYTGVGQADHFLIPKIISHYKARAASIELGNIDVFRDFSDVRWVVEAYQKLLLSDAEGEIFNLCSAQVHSLRDILETMNAMSGYAINVDINPLFIRPNEIETLRGDNTKLYSVLTDLTPPIPLEDTLRWMYESPSDEK